jgi:fibronectin-binding autotransporter adhesin
MKNKFHILLYLIVLLTMFVLVITTAMAQRFAVATGNWSGAIWATTAGGVAGSAATPTSADAVTINAGVTVTVDVTASCATLTFTGGNPTVVTAVTISGTNSLTITGALTINGQGGTTTGSANTLDVGTGTVSAGSVVLTGVTNSISKFAEIAISTGTVTVTGSITSDGTECRITFSDAGILYAGGTFMSGTAGTFTASTGTVNFNAAGAQTIAPFAYTFNNVTLSGSGVKTTTNATINGILSMEGTATISAAPVYGAAATLQYNTTTARTAAAEWITPFTGTGGVIIANTGTITLNGNKLFTACPLTVKEGSTLAVGARTIGGTLNALNLVCGGLTAGSTISGTGLLTLGGNVSVTDAGNGTFGATVSCPVALTNVTPRTFTVADDGTAAIDLTISGVISTTGSLVKAGAGTMLLSAANTYTGTTTISAGTLQYGIANALSTGAVIVNDGGTYDLNGFSDAIGALTVNSGAVGGTVTTGAGILTLGGNVTSTGGTTNASISGNLSLSATRTFTLTNTADGMTISAVISSSGVFGVTKLSAGVLTLSGVNTYTGVTTITAGTLSYNSIQNVSGGASALGAPTTAANGTIAIGAAGILQYTGSGHSSDRVVNLAASGGTIDASGSGTLTLSGGVTGNARNLNLTGTGAGIESGVINTTTGTVTKSGTGTWILSAANTYTGLTTINAGTLQYGIDNALSTGAVTVNDGGTYDLNGFSDAIGALTVNSGVVGGTVTTGAGTLTLGGNVTSTGGATNASISGNLALGAATRTFTLTNAAGGMTISAVISGAFGVTKAGAGVLTLSGANTYTGVTTITAGTLSYNSIQNVSGGASALGAPITAANGTIAIGATGILQYIGSGHSSNRVVNLTASGGTIDASGSGTLTLSGGVTGNTRNLNLIGTGAGIESGVIATTSGTLTKNGTGTWTLSGANSYTGLTTISAGTLIAGAAVSVSTIGPFGNAASAITLGNANTTTNNSSPTLLIGGAFTVARTITVANQATSGTYSIGGNADVNSNFSGAITINQPLSITQIATTGTNTLSITGGISAGSTGARNITFDDAGAVTIGTTVISNGTGSIAVVKQNSGKLTINTANTYTGGTTLNAGTLNINSPSALGTIAGTFTINGGTIDAASAIATVNYPQAWNGDFAFTGSNTLNLGSGAVTLSADRQVTVNGSTLTVGGTINDNTKSLTKAGAGTLSLGSNAVTLNNLTISAGTLTSTSGTMSLAGNFSNSGTFTHNSGTVTLNGTSAQTISGSSATTFNNLTLINSAGLSLSSSITVIGTLTLTNGALSVSANTLTFQTSDNPIVRTSGTITTTISSNLFFGTSGNTGGAAFAIPNGTFTTAPSINNFTINRTNSLTLNDQMMSLSGILLCNGPLTTNGNLTLLSTAAQTALIDGSGSGQVSGNVTMQRYLPSGFGYKYISSPFQSLTVNGFSSYVDLTATFPTFYEYDESKASSGWVSYVTTTNPLNPMQGYAANFGALAAAKTVDVTGVVNNGSLQITLYNNNQPYTLGFNLVGNPFPSPIDWNAASWTKTNIDNALYYFKAGITDQYTGTYSTYINGNSSDGLATNVIPSMQGFFVHVTDGSYPVTGNLAVTNSVRINDLTHAFLKSAKINTLPLLRITAGFVDNGTPSDPAVIYFDSSATQLFDKDFDALKLMNTDILVPNIYSMTPDTKRLSISAVPFPADSLYSIPLGLRTAKDGWITFKASDIEQIPTGMYIYLVDAGAGVNQDLKLNPQYRFFLNAGEYETRFSLVFSLTVMTVIPRDIPTEFSLSQNYPNPFNPRTTIKYSIPQTNFVSITVYNMLGKEVSKLVNEEKLSGSYEVQFDGSKLSSGVYFYSLHAGKFIETKKIMLLK